MNFKKVNVLLILILSISAFFRFYKFLDFQYLSLDEELLIATVRHIIWDRSPTLLVQNVALAFGLGPFFHYLLAPFFWVLNFNLVAAFAIPSALGIITTLLIYWAGKITGGKILGLTTAFLYASSFFASIFDRRLYHLTLDPIMAVLAFISLLKIINGDLRFFVLLSLPVGFAFHADPSLAVLIIAIFISFIFFKIQVRNRYFLYFLFGLFIFVIPFILAEVRYSGAVLGPVIKSITRPFREEDVSPVSYFFYPPSLFTDVLARTIFSKPSSLIETNFRYYFSYDKPLFSPLTQLFVIAVLFLSFLKIFRKESYEQKVTSLIWIFLISFAIGAYAFNILFKGSFYQHYFVVVIPIFFLALSQVIIITYKNMRFLFFLFIFLYLSVNLYSLLNSNVKYPLNGKVRLVKKSLNSLRDNKFSLYASESVWVQSAGWTELYTLEKHPPVKSFSYVYLDWIYKAYSLYPGPTQEEDPERIVWILNEDEPLPSQLPIVAKYSMEDMKLYVLDNSRNSVNR